MFHLNLISIHDKAVDREIQQYDVPLLLSDIDTPCCLASLHLQVRFGDWLSFLICFGDKSSSQNLTVFHI